MAGIPGKGGVKGRSGPPGNANALKHGARAADRHGVVLGTLPDAWRNVQNAVAEFRRNLEDALIAAKGTVSVGDAAMVGTACRWCQVSLLTQRLLRVHDTELKPDQKLAYATQIAEASDKCDRAVAKLGLAGSAAPAGGDESALSRYYAEQRAAQLEADQETPEGEPC